MPPLIKQNKKIVKAIIFDFDGVIAESVQVKTDAFAELYSSYGKNVVEKIIKHHEANGGISRFEKIKYYHKTFINIVLTEKGIKALAERFSELVVNKVIEAPYVPGSLEFIDSNYEKYKQFISTGTPTEEIKQILKERKINHYFTGVFGSPEKKINHIDQILSTYKLKSNELIFIGDSKTDLVAAEKANIKFILVKNKFNVELSQDYDGHIINDFVGLS